MNLGNFAGGVAQGFQQQQRTNLARQNAQSLQDYRSRSMQIQEQDAANRQQEADARQKERDRAEAMRQDSMKLYEQFYGPKEVTVAGDDGKPVTKTITLQPGVDPDTDNKWFAGKLMLAAKHGNLTMEQMKAQADRVDAAKRTAYGQNLEKMLDGDGSAMREFVKAKGRDPSAAKLDIRPVDGTMQITFGDGTPPIDLKRAALMNATAALYKQMLEEEKGAQGAAKTKAEVDEKTATGNLRQAQAGNVGALNDERAGLIKAQTTAANAAAGAHAAAAKASLARAENLGQSTKDARTDRIDKEARAQILLSADADPASLDGKQKNADMVGYMQGRSAELRATKKMAPAASVAAARKEWKDVEAQAGAWANGLKTMPSAEREKRYGTSDINKIKNAAIVRALGKNAQRATADTED